LTSPICIPACIQIQGANINLKESTDIPIEAMYLGDAIIYIGINIMNTAYGGFNHGLVSKLEPVER
jgi:hypothetical protein